jgi:hypothetical protein
MSEVDAGGKGSRRVQRSAMIWKTENMHSFCPQFIAPSAVLAGLDDLLTEVLAEILSRLPSQEDSLGLQHYSSKRDFYNISLCSRRLHEAVEVPLYAHIDGSCSVTAAVITRTFLDRPRLALLIREAMIEVKNGIGMAPTNDELTGSFGHDSLRTAVNAMGVPSWDGGPWVADFKAGRSDAREALMLSMLPNLRALSLNISSPLQYIGLLTAAFFGCRPCSLFDTRVKLDDPDDPDVPTDDTVVASPPGARKAVNDVKMDEMNDLKSNRDGDTGMSIGAAGEVDGDSNKSWAGGSDSDSGSLYDYSEDCDTDDDCNAGPEETRSFLYRHFTISIVANRTPGKPNLVFMKATLLHTKGEDNNPRM